MKRALSGVLFAALLASGLAGCAPSTTDGDPFIVPTVGAAKIDVDTLALRGRKADLGIEACVPGTGQNELPASTLACFGGGQAVDVASLQGPLVINLWASWCVPCRKELPLYAEFARLHSAAVPVIGIDYNDFAPDQAMELLAESGVTYPQLADPDGLLGGAALGNINPDRFLPIVVVVSADGAWHAEYKQIHTVRDLEDLVRDHAGVTL